MIARFTIGLEWSRATWLRFPSMLKELIDPQEQ